MILFLLLLLLPAIAIAGPERAWQAAPVYLPGDRFSTTVERARPAPNTPLVIYLHGCGGIDHNHDRLWARFLASEGYAVIMPDSMARQGRQSVCDPQRHSFSLQRFPQVYRYRQEEIEHSLRAAQHLPWVDPNQIFLMGHSEGGYAASLAGVEGFRSIIISGWGCGAGMGLRRPPNTNIVNLVFTRDPWYWGTWREGRCRDFDPSVEEVLVDRATHETYFSAEMRRAVIEHLRRQR